MLLFRFLHMVVYPGASGTCLENLLNLILKYILGCLTTESLLDTFYSPKEFRLSGNNFSASYKALELCWQIAPCSLQHLRPYLNHLEFANHILLPPRRSCLYFGSLRCLGFSASHLSWAASPGDLYIMTTIVCVSVFVFVRTSLFVGF